MDDKWLITINQVAAGRGFGDEDTKDGYSNSLAQLKEMIDYDSEDAMCGPRNYCELVKRKKYLLDQVFLITMYFGVKIENAITIH